MRLVVDTNVLLSALIANSATRRLILESHNSFYFPKDGLAEIECHWKDILAKTEMGDRELREVLSGILSKIELVPTEYFADKVQTADEVMSRIDPDDMPFLALALSIPDCAIWSNDRHLHSQKKVLAITTAGLLEA